MIRRRGLQEMYKIRSNVFLGVAGLVVLSLAGLASVTVRTAQEPRRQAEDDHRQVIEAVRRGGLREAAKLKGSYVVTRNAGWDAVFADLESLASHSAMVVIGTPIEASSRISPEGNNVLTDFRVSVIEMLKGEGAPGTPITVTAVGGLVRFADGTSAEVRTPDLEIQTGRTYAFFLNEKDQLNGFHITGGSQGVFELRSDGTGVHPQGRKTDITVEKYKAKNLDRFLLDIRQAVAKWPNTQKCCK
jgi:hypothetical protein